MNTAHDGFVTDNMKLAEKLHKKSYRPPPIPKPPREETEKERFARKFGSAKTAFKKILADEYRERLEKNQMNWFDYLDVPVHSYDFKDMFVSYDEGAYRDSPFKYVLKTDSWFYKFLLWLHSEGFKLEEIRMHKPYDPDDSYSYNFRVRW